MPRADGRLASNAFAEEGHQHHSRHVERGDARTQQRGTAQQRADAAGANAASMIASLEKKPANGGTPIIARYARPKVANVTGRAARRPP